MAIHAITFRIHNDLSYQDRYDSVVGAIKASTATTYWDEPTSFVLVQADATSTQVAEYIDIHSHFAASKDLLLVINLSQKGYATRGKVTDHDLAVLMDRR